MQRLVKAAVALDRALAERGNDDGRPRLVEGAFRLTENVRPPGPTAATCLLCYAGSDGARIR